MTLLSALNVGSNALAANQIGLSVTGHNIANANTPGYIREDVEFTPAPTIEVGGLSIGLGVRVNAIVQKVDEFVAERLRDAKSDVASGGTQEGVYLELESLLSELSSTDLSTSISQFFAAIHDVVNQPESTSVRNVAVLEGHNLTSNIQRLSSQVRDIRHRQNDEVVGVVDNINEILADVSKLNVQILNLEGGLGTSNKAVSLRDQRSLRLSQLADYVDVKVVRQENGTVNVLTGGEYLVSGGLHREVEVHTVPDDYLNANFVRIKETGGPLAISAGRLDGLLVSRDEILGGFEESLDDLVQTLAYEFNRVYSQGQGLEGFQELKSRYNAEDVTRTLDAAGLPYTPENGTLSIAVRNRATGETSETQIRIELNGLPDDLTVEGFRTALDGIDGLNAFLSADGHLELTSTDPRLEFTFGEDTSGVLAAFGLNTFFDGSSANDIGINQDVIDNPALFSASRGGVGNDVDNALILADLAAVAFESANGRSINQLYADIVAETAQGAATTKAVVDGYRVYANTLESQHLSVAGVNLDEEAINLLSYQKSYQAAARYIQTVNEMLDILLSI